tara:strand:+ start:1111 stop:2109 length:999 start_codon:yes stop_codon:yes gene_type:complete
MILCVNYHYVGHNKTLYKGINGISVKQFIDQIEWLRKHFRLLHISDLIEIVNEGTIKEPCCIITFDDGLRCHYEIIYKLSIQKKLPITFFISTSPIKENTATLVHKSQFIRSNINLEYLSYELNRFIENKNVNCDLYSDDMAVKHYRYDNLSTAKMKYLLNYILSKNHQEEFINGQFKSLVNDEKAFCDDWYASKSEIREMHQNNRCIGSHAHSHLPLAKLDDSSAFSEINDSRGYLENITGAEIQAISYPLGNENAVTKREGIYANQAGYLVGLTMEREINRTVNDPLLLARIDCNDLPVVGNSPIFKEQDGKFLHKDSDKASSRKRYYRE